MIMYFNFIECEHEGDLEVYLADLRSSGATIKSTDINEDAETAEVSVEVPMDKVKEFGDKFKSTDSYQFSGGM